MSGLPDGARTLVRVGKSDSRAVNGGRFDVPGVLPGVHTVEGFAVLEDQTASAAEEVRVGAADVEGLTLRFARSVSVTGTLRSEAPVPEDFSFGITLLSSQTEFSTRAEWDADGTHFNFSKLASGPYRLLISQPPPPWYVKSARFNDEQIGDAEFVLAAASTLEISVGNNPAAINGRAIPGSQIVVMTPNGPALTTRARPDGAFRFANLAPGDYDLYVFDAAAEVEFANPSWMQANAPVPRRIHAGPNSDVHVPE